MKGAESRNRDAIDWKDLIEIFAAFGFSHRLDSGKTSHGAGLRLAGPEKPLTLQFLQLELIALTAASMISALAFFFLPLKL